MSLRRAFAGALLAFAVVGCGPGVTPTPAPTATPAPTLAATAAPAKSAPATATPSAGPVATATTEPALQAASGDAATVQALATELAAKVRGELTPAPDPNAKTEPRITGVEVVPLGPDKTGRERFLVYSYGLRSFKPEQRHFVAVYAHDASGWQKSSQVDLDNSDYLDQKSVTVAPIEPTHTWLAVQAGAGAHAGVFTLLSYDGEKLKLEVSHSTASPGADGVRDVDGDGKLEVVLDSTDYYVFCYACGVREVNLGVMRWDGQKLVEVKLLPVPPEVPKDVRDLATKARDLADAGLWKDAAQAIDQIAPPMLADQTVYWNAALIRLNAQARGQQAKSGAYPLLDNVLYGDYAAALEVMRPVGAAGIFRSDTPLVVGTSAEPQRSELAKRLVAATTAANRVRPDLAAAFFLRGWAGFLARPTSRDWLPDIQQAAKLAPNEQLYAQSIEYLKNAPAPAAATTTTKSATPTAMPSGSVRIRFAVGASSASLAGRLAPNETMSYVLRATKDQQLTIDVVPASGGAIKISVSGADDGQLLTPAASSVTTWQGKLPATQDYVIRLVGGAAATDYSLTVKAQ